MVLCKKTVVMISTITCFLPSCIDSKTFKDSTSDEIVESYHVDTLDASKKIISLEQDSSEENLVTSSGIEQLQSILVSQPDTTALISTTTQQISVSTSTESQKKIESTKPVTIVNAITKDELGYYKVFKMRYPEKFVLKIDGQPVAEGKSISTTKKEITISYDYEWRAPWNTYTGTKSVTYAIPDNASKLDIHFDHWDNDERIRINGAIKTSPEVLIEDQSLKKSDGKIIKKR